MHIFVVLAYRWGGGGDVNIHCIASSEDVVRWRSLLHTEGVGGGGMITFIALCHQKMLLRWRSFLHTDGGGGGDVHCIASSENVVTLNMLLRSICCYVQDVVMLKMLCWRCCYVEDVVMLKMLLQMLSKRLCGCEEKKGSCPFRPWFSGGLWHFYVYQKKPEIPKDTQFQCEKQKWSKLMNLKKTKQHWNRGQHIPDMLSACGTNSWYSHVIGRTQNTVKHSEQWHFSNWNTMNFTCLPRNLQPLPLVWISMNFALDFPWYSWISLRRSPCLQTLEE